MLAKTDSMINKDTNRNYGHKIIFAISLIPIILFLFAIIKSFISHSVSGIIFLPGVLVYSTIIFLLTKKLVSIKLSLEVLETESVFSKKQTIQYSNIIKITKLFNHFTLLKPMAMHPFSIKYRNQNKVKEIIFFSSNEPDELEKLVGQNNEDL